MSHRDYPLFKEGSIWRERSSGAYIILGHRLPNGKVPCSIASMEEDAHHIVFRKKDFWGELAPEVIFDKFYKIF